MDIYTIRCKHCDKRLLTYIENGFRKYKSPVKTCKKCGTKYADPRCHEIAVEGIPFDTFSIPSYVLMSILGILILYRGRYLFGMHALGMPGESQWLSPSLLVIFGAIMIIVGIIHLEKCIAYTYNMNLMPFFH